MILRYMRSDAYGPRRNLFSMACSSQLLARAMSNGGNPFLEGHGNLERTRKGSQGIEARSYEKKKKIIKEMCAISLGEYKLPRDLITIFE